MKTLTPIKAIRAKCRDCSNDQEKEIRECPIEKCPLFPYRMGKNPNRAGMGNKNPSFLRSKTDSTSF